MSKKIISDEEIIIAVKKARSFSETQKLLGKSNSGSSYMWIKKRIKFLNINTSHFNPHWNNQGKKNDGGKNKLKFEEILIYNLDLQKRIKSHQLRRAMLEIGMEYKCKICGLFNWNGKKITLEIDHIDGNWKNNLILNLRFVCPNCHSQTHNYGYVGKKVEQEDIKLVKKCYICSKILYSKQNKYCSIKCTNLSKIKYKQPTTKELIFCIKSNLSIVSIGKKYGVSEALIRKWCKNKNIPFKCKERNEFRKS